MHLHSARQRVNASMSAQLGMRVARSHSHAVSFQRFWARSFMDILCFQDRIFHANAYRRRHALRVLDQSYSTPNGTPQYVLIVTDVSVSSHYL